MFNCNVFSCILKKNVFNSILIKKSQIIAWLLKKASFYQKNFVFRRRKIDNERVIIEANHGVNIKLNPIRNGRRILTIA